VLAKKVKSIVTGLVPAAEVYNAWNKLVDKSADSVGVPVILIHALDRILNTGAARIVTPIGIVMNILAGPFWRAVLRNLGL
jgi:hypothetical protein